MKRSTFIGLIFVGIVIFFGSVCIGADDVAQSNKWKKAGAETSKAAGSVADATVDSSKKAWKGTKKASGEVLEKTKDVSSETWDKTKYATKEAWEKAKARVHAASAPAGD